MAGADQQPNRYNAFGGVARAEARVMGFIKRDVEKQKKQMLDLADANERACVWNGKILGSGVLLFMSGQRKGGAETALMYLSYNIRRVISLAGA